MIEISDYARSLSEQIVYDVCHNEVVKTSADAEFVLSKLVTLLADELNSWIWDNHIIEQEREKEDITDIFDIQQ